uniref:SAM domain-containing protein n=1 Tax=Caenorhabditis tropicalis TaxID=1561998 RepID=A0A1I7TF68_9PELO
MESRPPSREERVREDRKELRTLQEENESLIEKLLQVERELNTQLKSGLTRANRFRDFAMYRNTYPPFRNPPAAHAPPTPPFSASCGAQPSGTFTNQPPSFSPLKPAAQKIIMPPGTENNYQVTRVQEELVNWLRGLEIDERSTALIASEAYTKNDLIDFVTRDELLNIGVGGGSSCRIMRAIGEIRERQRRHPVFLSPNRSRDDSLDDYHSSSADDMYTVAAETPSST